jgi:hypothetical protein
MPIAARVPIIVAIIDEMSAKTRVFKSELIISSSSKSVSYHLRENPEKLDLLLDSLKEKTIKTSMGA